MAAALLRLAFVIATAAAAPDAELVQERIDTQLLERGGAHETGSRVIAIHTAAGLVESVQSFAVPPFTEMVEVSGEVVLPDGTTVALDQRDVIDTPYFDGSALVREYRVVSAHFPRAIAGSSIRVRWRRKIDSSLFLSDWVFRGPLPIRDSEYTITAPPTQPLRFDAPDDAPAPVIDNTEDGVQYRFSIQDSPPFVREDFVPPAAVFGVVQVWPSTVTYDGATYGFGTWGEVASFYDQLAGRQTQLDATISGNLQVEAKRLKSPRARLGAVYHRLAAFRYLQVYLGAGGYRPHAAMWTSRRRFGDCKDLTTLFLAMARAEGLDAQPVLTAVTTGRPLREDIPSPRQFNHVIARVNLPEGPLWVDATAPTYTLGDLPSVLRGAPGLVVLGGDRYELVTLPTTGKERDRAVATLTFDLPGGDPLTAAVTTVATGDYAASARRLRRRDRSRVEGSETAIVVPAARPGASITDLTYSDDGNAVTMKATLSLPFTLLTTDRGRLLFPGLVLEDPRLGAFASDSRVYPLDLGWAGSSEHVFVARGAARCPPETSFESRFGSYSLRCDSSDQGVRLTRILTVVQPLITVDAYAAARRFFQAVNRADQRAVGLGL